MPPVRKRVLENKKSELNPVVKEVKTAITATHHENIPIERVIYVNDSVNVQHVPGTNRYVIPFPETWRTTNGNHILGVRSIQLKHGYKRTFGFKMNFKYYDYVKNNIVEKITKEPFVFEINYSNETPNIEEWITELNKLWSTYIKMFNFEFEGENRVKLDNYTWKYTFSEGEIVSTEMLVQHNLYMYIYRESIIYTMTSAKHHSIPRVSRKGSDGSAATINSICVSNIQCQTSEATINQSQKSHP